MLLNSSLLRRAVCARRFVVRQSFVVALSAAMLVSVVSAAGKKSAEPPWSFRPIVAPAAPQVANDQWCRGDVDRFVLARLEKEGLAPNADADRLTLLRRLAFDLTGLPPTEAEMRAFLLDKRTDDQAIAKVVADYLASPRFGERWGRHWLDVVHYADSAGRTFNPPFTYAWRYRDYVIDALNKDKPYDRFVLEQLAGDLLPAKSVEERRENLVATGMLTLGAHDLQSLSHEQFVMDGIDDQIDVTSRALLGLTISCARCHDHKYDPVTMRDYYALAGIFYSSKMLPGVAYRGQGNGYVDPDQLHVLPVSLGRQALPELVDGVHSMNDFNAVWSKGKRDIRYTTDPNRAMGLAEDEIADCPLREKGDPHERGPAPPRGDMKIPNLPPIEKPGAMSSGRLELARWITSPRHPLTARVMANRVWLHLFGTGLVATPDDFGVNSEPPSHPELLDHLAARLQSDWSVKKLITAIVTSRAYRLSGNTVANSAARERDPQNAFYWRANLRRLEFEPLRDSLLFVSGQLDEQRPEGIQVAGIGGKSLKTAAKSLLSPDSSCRTIYLPVLRSFVPDVFGTFDFPDPSQICGRREVTTVAPQALYFMNSSFVTDSAAETASLVLKQDLRDDTQRILWLYRRLLGRIATMDERDDAIRFLRGGGQEQWTTLVQALMCSAEFRYVR